MQPFQPNSFDAQPATEGQPPWHRGHAHGTRMHRAAGTGYTMWICSIPNTRRQAHRPQPCRSPPEYSSVQKGDGFQSCHHAHKTAPHKSCCNAQCLLATPHPPPAPTTNLACPGSNHPSVAPHCMYQHWPAPSLPLATCQLATATAAQQRSPTQCMQSSTRV